MKNKKTKKDRKPHKAIKIPNIVRTFSEAENSFLHKLPYGDSGKLLKPSKRSKQSIALDHVKLTIQIIEINSTKKGFRLSVHQLGKIVGSNATAARILDCLVSGKIVHQCQYFDKDQQIARLYNIHSNFRNADLWQKILEKKVISN